MRNHRIQRAPRRKKDEGIIIVLVAVFMLFVVGAMAALAIDVTSFYTARSEAQLVADGAALAGARVLANSSMTSNPALVGSALTTLCQSVANQVAASNLVGGTTPTINVTCTTANSNNPTVTATVTTSLPTFFARIWGSTSVTTKATATAEAYNPSGVSARGGEDPPVAPLCVKPWLLPNLDPTTAASGNRIFDPTTGAINNASTVIGATWVGGGIVSNAGSQAAGKYYPAEVNPVPGGNQLLAPSTALPSCSTGFNSYQLAVAACVPQPMACGGVGVAQIDVDNSYVNNTGSLDSDTVQAVECLTHNDSGGGSPTAGDSDSISASTPTPPFDFLGGSANPIPGTVGKDILVSESLVTIPVYNYTGGASPPQPTTIIGFVQVFLNPQSTALPAPNGTSPLPIPATIVNVVGCGSDATGTPVYGNGPSAVPVRLITP